MGRTWTAAAAGLLAAAVLPAGCDRGPDRPGPEPPAGPVAEPFRAGIVRPSTLDPAQARTVDELLVADQLYDSLSALEAGGPGGPGGTGGSGRAGGAGRLVPALAASWTATPDQRQWEFRLRPGARFSDGRAVTGADVKATLERIAAKGSGSSVADLLEPVTGYRAVAVDGTTGDLAGVTAPAPDVVRIDLDQPLSVLPELLSNPAFGVVPEAAVDAGALPEVPVGSGPFRLAHRDDDLLALEPADGVRARSARLELVLFADRAASYAAFESGAVDWSAVPSDRAVAAGRRYGRRLFTPYVAELFYAFNLRHPALADPRLREAVVRAVDRWRIIEDVYGQGVLPADGLVMAGLPEHQAAPCPERCPFDPGRAAELVSELAAAGVAVPELPIDFEDDPTQTAVAAALRDDLAAAGIPAVLRPRPLEDYQRFVVTGEQGLFRLGWVAPYPSADAVLHPLFRTGSPNNLSGLASPAVDDLLARARAEAGAGRRRELYQEAERAVLAELVVVPIAQFQIPSVASRRVKGLALTATGTFDGRDVWLARP